MLSLDIGIASQRRFQCVPTAYGTKNKDENYLEIYIFQVTSIVVTSFRHPKLPISIKIPVILL